MHVLEAGIVNTAFNSIYMYNCRQMDNSQNAAYIFKKFAASAGWFYDVWYSIVPFAEPLNSP